MSLWLILLLAAVWIGICVMVLAISAMAAWADRADELPRPAAADLATSGQRRARPRAWQVRQRPRCPVETGQDAEHEAPS